MADQSMTVKVPGWARALRFIPLLITVLCVILLLIYKPDNYGALLFGIIGAYVMAAIIMLFAIRKNHKRNQKNG
jgi:L-asparagine transporter-like permease